MMKHAAIGALLMLMLMLMLMMFPGRAGDGLFDSRMIAWC